MAVTALHPILYVEDPYTERDFFARFGFATTYEGDEFPGFLALECGDARFGVSSNRALPSSGAYEGIRWQLIVDDVDSVVAVCDSAEVPYELIVENGGVAFRSRIVVVTSPNGVPVWFEGPNEVA
jgi:hypothetical protein